MFAPNSPTAMRWLSAALTALLVVASLGLVAPLQAQNAGRGSPHPSEAEDVLSGIEGLVQEAGTSIAAGGTPTEELETLREQLLTLRLRASEIERNSTKHFNELSKRLEELGEPPPESVTEPLELAQRRRQLASDVATAQLPVVRAQEALLAINDLVRTLDGKVWERLSSELLTRGPSPLLPSSWASTMQLVSRDSEEMLFGVRAHLAQKDWLSAAQSGLAGRLALAVVGLTLMFGVRRRLAHRTERELAKTQSRRRVAWLVVMRNVARLVVPLTGAALLLAAIDLSGVAASAEDEERFAFAPLILAIVAAGWLGNGLFSARLPAYRLVPCDDREASGGVRLVLLLGAVLATHFLLVEAFRYRILPAAATATLYFPIFVVGGVALWRAARLIGAMRGRLSRLGKAAGAPPSGHLGMRILSLLENLVYFVAAAAPLLAAIGYIAAATGLMFPMIMTLALVGAGFVFFDLFHRIAISIDQSRVKGSQDGLGPVLSVAFLVLLGLPLLALIWGARPSDIASIWILLREGGTFGGITISAESLVKFGVTFAIIFGLTRILRRLLRASVLPRTRMDAGGRNAVLAGVSYVGFFLALTAAVYSTGIDLSSLAIVAGALSVGIGFGLQNVVSNFVSGIILLVERPIKEGDWIEVGEYVGYVRAISVRSTSIETFDQATVILPNSDLVAGTVLNRTHVGMSGRLSVPVRVGFESDPRRVEAVLLSIAQSHPLVLTYPEPMALFMGFGANAMDFEIRCWLRDINFLLNARSDMNFEITERFRAEGIRIPLPFQDIRIEGLAQMGGSNGPDGTRPKQT